MSNEIYSFTIQTVDCSTATPETVVNDTTARNPLGSQMKWKGNIYRYVKFDNGTGNIASAAAGLLYWLTLTPAASTPVYTATSDASDAVISVSGGAGVAKGVVTDLSFTFLATGGTHLCQIAASAVTGDRGYGHATTDLIMTRNAVATACPDIPFGISLETRGATVASQCNMLLLNMVW